VNHRQREGSKKGRTTALPERWFQKFEPHADKRFKRVDREKTTKRWTTDRKTVPKEWNTDIRKVPEGLTRDSEKVTKEWTTDREKVQKS